MRNRICVLIALWLDYINRYMYVILNTYGLFYTGIASHEITIEYHIV